MRQEIDDSPSASFSNWLRPRFWQFRFVPNGLCQFLSDPTGPSLPRRRPRKMLRLSRRVVVTVCQRQTVTTDGDNRMRCRNFAGIAVQPLALGTGKCTATGNPRHVGPSFPVLCRVHDVPCSKSWSLRERCGSCNLRHHICIDAHHFISPEPLTHDILAQRQWALKRPSLDGAS